MDKIESPEPEDSQDGLYRQSAPEFRVASSVEQLNIIEAPSQRGLGAPLLPAPTSLRTKKDCRQPPKKALTQLHPWRVKGETGKFQTKKKMFTLYPAFLHLLKNIRWKWGMQKPSRQN